jgi:CheY-like chemotaxis protein
MSEAKNNIIESAFITNVRRALDHLYDPAALRRSPLTHCLPLDPQEEVASALRHLLLQAIEALKPDQAAPVYAQEWRYYHILLQRFAEQFMQREVAQNLGLSIRQLRRQELLAVRELGAYLWAHYQLAERLDWGSPSAQIVGDAPAAAPTVSREEELAWSEKSFPSTSIEIRPLFTAMMQTVRPLADLLHVEVEFAVPEWLPQLAVQVVTVRQALLSALTTAIRFVPGGQITVTAEAHCQEVVIAIAGRESGLPSRGWPGEESSEGLAIARQLIGFSGGRLELTPVSENTSAFVIHIALPTEEQWTVLAIDDNPDTLALLQRYTSGTRYNLVGVREPAQALALAEALRPQVIMLDVMLPGIDGWELLGRIRAHPKIGSVPVLVCTVLPEEQLALALGAAGLLRKPLSRSVVLAALDTQVEWVR